MTRNPGQKEFQGSHPNSSSIFCFIDEETDVQNVSDLTFESPAK